MVEGVARVILTVVCTLLVLGIWRQFVVSNARSEYLDQLAILPQWKFFAQQRIDGDCAAFDDIHLLVRMENGAGDPALWRELPLFEERTLRDSFWNPHSYSSSLIAQHAALLIRFEGDADRAVKPWGLPYLTVLRFCFDQEPIGPTDALQFAIVQTRGRSDRNPRIKFLSAWHRT